MAQPSLSKIVLVAALSAALSGVSAAQTTTMTGTASVVTPMTVNIPVNLLFGTVYPGLAKTISTTQNSSLMGKYTISGQNTATVNLTFTLPATLTGSGTATGQSLAIDSWNGYQGVGATQTSGGAAFTPSASASPIVLGSSTTNIWIGATVSPTFGQKAGTYNGTIIMAVAYSGS